MQSIRALVGAGMLAASGLCHADAASPFDTCKIGYKDPLVGSSELTLYVLPADREAVAKGLDPKAEKQLRLYLNHVDVTDDARLLANDLDGAPCGQLVHDLKAGTSTQALWYMVQHLPRLAAGHRHRFR